MYIHEMKNDIYIFHYLNHHKSQQKLFTILEYKHSSRCNLSLFSNSD